MANIDWNQFAINSAKPSYSGRFYYELDTNQGKYWYVPQEFVNQGLRQGDTQFIEQSFLNKDYLNVLNPVRLDESIDIKNLVNAGYKDPYSGFLIKDEDYKKYDVAPEWVTTYNAVGKFAGPIQGIGEKDGNLVYSFAGADGSTYGVIDKSGTPTETTVTIKKSGGLLGDIFRAVGSVPFLPEIAGLATGNPYVYAALKGVQGGVAGEDPLKVGLNVGATIFGANAIGGLSSPTSAGTGITPGAAGITGLTPGAAGATGLAAPSGFVLSPELGTTLATSAALNQPASTDLLSGTTFPQQGLQVPPIDSSQVALVPQGTVLPGEGLLSPTLPSVGAMGGAQGLSVGVPGGTITQAGLTPTGAVPVLGDASSFINNPDVLGQPVISPEASTISLQQALRGLNLANQLLNPPEQPGMPMGMDQGGGGMRAQGVDYSGLLGLLQARAGTPGVSGLLSPAQIRYPSLLG